MWLNWVKYTDPVVELTLLPNKRLLETTVPYYLLGLKPPDQTLGRAGIWKKIAQTMEEAELTRPRTMLMPHDKDESDTSTKVKSEEDEAEPFIKAKEEKGVAAAEAAAAEEAVATEEMRHVATGNATGSERMRKAEEERSVSRRPAGSGRERHGVWLLVKGKAGEYVE